MKSMVRRFSAAASRYEEKAQVQKEVADDLIQRVRVRSGQTVLDIGTGTGYVLNALRDREPGALYFGIDAALGMLSLHSGDCVAGDASCLPLRSASVDWVVSSSCYQWVPSLSVAFHEAYRVLKSGGHFQIALFGRATLCEFRAALSAGSPELAQTVALWPALPSLEEAGAAVAGAGFTCFDFEQGQRRMPFPTVLSTWRWLKAVGANGWAQKFYISRSALARAEEYYASQGQGQMTFDIIILEAVK